MSERANPIYCCVDSRPVPDDRAKRRGLAAVTCSDECYGELRRRKKRPVRGRRVSDEEFALVLRIRRARSSGKAEVTLPLQ